MVALKTTNQSSNLTLRLTALLLLMSASATACKSKSEPPPPAPTPAAAPAPVPVAKPPLRVAYSDWPGWTAWEIALQKGWFKEEGVDVAFSWFDYMPSMDAFSAGKVDAVAVANCDALLMGANGAKSKFILLNDYSNGNDQVIAGPKVRSFKDLKGKKVGLELTLVDHLLFVKGMDKFGLKAGDVQLVNFPTNETPQALSSGQVSAIAAWYPISAQARKSVAGAKALFTSADVPGLIYDTLAVNPTSLVQRKEDWAKVVKVWYRVSDYVRDPKTQSDAVAIMAAKVGVPPADYAAHVPGTYFLSLAEAKKRFEKGDTLESLYGSTRTADAFNVENKVYKEAQVVDDYIYPDFVAAM
jgi:NitT/TauT family transport system substrate-binding protein